MKLPNIFSSKQAEIPATGALIYTKAGCEHCAAARLLLEKYGILFEERSLEKIENRQELSLLLQADNFTGDTVTTPQIWMDGKYIGGRVELETLLAIGKRKQNKNT